MNIEVLAKIYQILDCNEVWKIKSALAFPKEGAGREYGLWVEASPLS